MTSELLYIIMLTAGITACSKTAGVISPIDVMTVCSGVIDYSFRPRQRANNSLRRAFLDEGSFPRMPPDWWLRGRVSAGVTFVHLCTVVGVVQAARFEHFDKVRRRATLMPRAVEELIELRQ